LIDLQKQLAEIPYLIFQNVNAEYDDNVSELEKKNSTLKNKIEKSLDGDERVAYSKEIDKNLAQELSLTKEKEAYIQRELKTKTYTIGQQAEMNTLLLDTLDSESSIGLAIKQQYDDKIAIIQSAESKVTEILAKQVEERKKLISDQYDAEKKAIDDKKALYSKENTSDDYNKNLATEQKTLNDINASISSASRDSSSSGQARVAQLNLDKKTQQDKIDEMVLNRARDINNDKFDAESTKLDEQNTKTLEALDKTYSEEEITKMAKDAVATGYLKNVNDEVVSLRSAYIDFENEFGQGMSTMGDSIRTNLIATLTEATGLIKLMTLDGSIKVSTTNSKLPSHKTGLDVVPYDSYIAELHKDESVLTADDAGTWRTLKAKGILNNLGQVKSQPTFNGNLSNFNIPKMNDVDMRGVSNTTNAPVVNFNRPFIEIENADKSILPDMDKWANKAMNMAISSIYNAINVPMH